MPSFVSGPVDELQAYLQNSPPQLDSMWEFYIDSGNRIPSVGGSELNDSDLRFHVTDLSIPFPKLLYEFKHVNYFFKNFSIPFQSRFFHAAFE